MLIPIDLLIETFLPDINNLLISISNVFDLISNTINWVTNLVGLSPEFVSILSLYFVFTLTLPLQLYVIKLAIKWYNALKI